MPGIHPEFIDIISEAMGPTRSYGGRRTDRIVIGRVHVIFRVCVYYGIRYVLRFEWMYQGVPVD